VLCGVWGHGLGRFDLGNGEGATFGDVDAEGAGVAA
jgi:hypothetical protein